MTTEDKIEILFTNAKDFLKYKNCMYGDSALKPLKIFSKNSNNDIEVRLDDKLSRILNSDKLRKNDVTDLFGYIALLLIQNDWTDFTEYYE